MGNCLVTKLKGVVDNPNLSTLGVFKLKFTSQDGGGITISYMVRSEATKVTFDKLVTIDGTVGTELIIPGSDTDPHYVTSLAAGEYTMVVGDKYSLATLVLPVNKIDVKEMIDFEYLEGIYNLVLSYNGDDEVDLSNINHNTSGPFDEIRLQSPFKFTGDFPQHFVENRLDETRAFTASGFTSTEDISDMRIRIPFNWLNINGKMTMNVPEIVNGVTGNHLGLENSPNFYGDLSDARLENVKHIIATNSGAFEWKGTRTNYIQLEKVSFKTPQDVDNMLINQAAIVNTKPEGANLLSIRGAQRTSASDAAVATLEAAGVTVIFM